MRVGIGRNALSAESINHPFQVFCYFLALMALAAPSALA